MNWQEPLEYTFISIEKKDTISGVETEKNIELKKEEFIKSARNKQ